MYETFYDYLAMADTDGVVAPASAQGKGLSFEPKGSNTFPADHVELTTLAMPMAIGYLTGATGGTAAAGSAGGSASAANAFTYGTLMSPAHLHAFDAQGRHVGLDASGKVELGIPGAYFSGPEEQTGVPESIYVPGDAQIRFEVRGYQEGTFGLVARQQTAAANVEVTFRDVPIKPGQTATLPLAGERYAEL